MFQKYLPMIWQGLFLFCFLPVEACGLGASVHWWCAAWPEAWSPSGSFPVLQLLNAWWRAEPQSPSPLYLLCWTVVEEQWIWRRKKSREGMNETSRWRQWGNHRSSCITYFLGDTESSSIVDSSSPSRPKWSLLFFCKNTTHKVINLTSKLLKSWTGYLKKQQLFNAWV